MAAEIRFTKAPSAVAGLHDDALDREGAPRDERSTRAAAILRDPDLSATQKITDALAVLDPPKLTGATRVCAAASDLLGRKSASPEERALGQFLRSLAGYLPPNEELVPGGDLDRLLTALEVLR